MKKNKIIFLLMSILTSYFGLTLNSAFAQCPNVFASNGSNVITSDGAYVTLSYPTSACTQISATAIKIVEVDVFVMFENALSDVRFATNSDSLTSTSYTALKKIVTLMNSDDYILKISGYADSIGTDSYNKKLSADRARAVKTYLIDQGVNKNRIKVAAYGEKMPKAPNATSIGRAYNRRVEFDLYY